MRTGFQRADAVVLSLSHIPSDVRILRQIGALEELRYNILCIGVNSADPTDRSKGRASFGVRHPTWPFTRKALIAATFLAARPITRGRVAEWLANLVPGVRGLRMELRRAFKLGVISEGAFLLANDWTALPAALEAHRHFGVQFHYDTHEFAIGEHAKNRFWRLLFPRLIEEIERAGTHSAVNVSCVGPGISRALAERYKLKSPPKVIMNIPDVHPIPPSNNSGIRTALYHGLFKPDRGLERLIEGVQYWPDEFMLILRGKASNEEYLQSLIQLAEKYGRGRINFEAMVPSDRVVKEANKADIGILVFDTEFTQTQLAMPNKLFEYIYASLLPIVASSTDAANFLSFHHIGKAVDPADTKAIASILCRLDAKSLKEQKNNVFSTALRIANEKKNRDFSTILHQMSEKTFAKQMP